MAPPIAHWLENNSASHCPPRLLPLLLHRCGAESPWMHGYSARMRIPQPERHPVSFQSSTPDAQGRKDGNHPVFHPPVPDVWGSMMPPSSSSIQGPENIWKAWPQQAGAQEDTEHGSSMPAMFLSSVRRAQSCGHLGILGGAKNKTRTFQLWWFSMVLLAGDTQSL